MDRRPAPDPRDPDTGIDQAWRDHRRHLLDIGFRMLGNLAEAEDVVQEAFARLVRADVDDIEDLRGWLAVVVSRLCLDRLRSERRHPSAPSATLGDRPDPTPGPADRLTLDDRIRAALHLVLERLTPAERTALVLHDVFQFPFETIGEIVGRTPAACRQLASRARRTIRADAGPGRFAVEPAEQRRVTERFIAACTTGDLDGLLTVLDPEVAGRSDVARQVVTGRRPVARSIMHYLGPDSGATVLSLPTGTGAGVMALLEDRVAAVVTLTVRDGRVVHIDVVADPAALAPLRAALGDGR